MWHRWFSAKLIKALAEEQQSCLLEGLQYHLSIYVSHLDFRYDNVDVWASHEKQNYTKVFVGLIKDQRNCVKRR